MMRQTTEVTQTSAEEATAQQRNHPLRPYYHHYHYHHRHRHVRYMRTMDYLLHCVWMMLRMLMK
jgi:hypothetical protein